MSISFARFLSILLHPVLMPSYIIWFLLHNCAYFSFATTPIEQLALYIIIVVNTLVLPVVFIRFMVRRGWISSMEMDERKERTIPYLLNVSLLLVSYYLVHGVSLPRIYGTLLLGAAIAVALTLLINLRWKISVHMVGVGGFLGILFGVSNLFLTDFHLPIVITLLISGLLGTARLTLGAHTSRQIYAGMFIGFICEFFILSF